VFDPKLTRAFGEILVQLGRKGAWVVHGRAGADQGMDELSTLGVNEVCQLAGGRLSEARIDPKTLGFGKASLEELVGGDAAENAIMLEGVLAGTIKGAKRDIAVLNAAAGFVITGKAADLAAGTALAEELLNRGAPHAKLRAMQDLC